MLLTNHLAIKKTPPAIKDFVLYLCGCCIYILLSKDDLLGWEYFMTKPTRVHEYIFRGRQQDYIVISRQSLNNWVELGGGMHEMQTQEKINKEV